MKYIHSINNKLKELLKTDERILLLGEDIGEPYGGAFKVTKGLQEIFPQRVIQTPMSESSLPGIGIGLALEGYIPIIEIMFGDFLTLCADQIINHASIFRSLYNLKLPLIIRTPMGGYRGYGATHSKTIEKIFFGVPALKIVAPNILFPPGELLEMCTRQHFPILFIENKLDYSKELLNNHDNFNIELNRDNLSHVLTIKGESDYFFVIFAYGGFVEKAMDLAWSLFQESELSSKIVIPMNISNLEPLLSKENLDSKNIIVLEESTKEGGFSSEIARIILEKKIRISTFNRFSAKNYAIGSSEKLEKFILPDFIAIRNELLEEFGE
jgi:pyruvate/2-oxoglutarate/acetoin dehydrogenase E1 component